MIRVEENSLNIFSSIANRPLERHFRSFFYFFFLCEENKSKHNNISFAKFTRKTYTRNNRANTFAKIMRNEFARRVPQMTPKQAVFKRIHSLRAQDFSPSSERVSWVKIPKLPDTCRQNPNAYPERWCPWVQDLPENLEKRRIFSCRCTNKIIKRNSCFIIFSK